MGTVKVWSYDKGNYIKKQSIGKVKYIGESFGAVGLTDGKVYDCLGVEGGFLRVVDDEEMDYLYCAKNPAPLDWSSTGGRWEIIEDDDKGTLQNAITE